MRLPEVREVGALNAFIRGRLSYPLDVRFVHAFQLFLEGLEPLRDFLVAKLF